MAFGDRLILSIKDFGRRVVIEAKRGKEIELSEDKKTATIRYDDDENRGKRLPRGAGKVTTKK